MHFHKTIITQRLEMETSKKINHGTHNFIKTIYNINITIELTFLYFGITCYQHRLEFIKLFYVISRVAI